MISCAKIVHRTKEKYVMGPYAFLQDETPVFLAPMSGVTDAPFRKQVMKYGAEVTITEMVAGEELLNGSKSASTRLVNESLSGAHVVQLVGREERALKYGAERARDAGAHVIDINMGCPSRRVTGGLSGSALMRDLDKAERLIHAVLKGAEGIPVGTGIVSMLQSLLCERRIRGSGWLRFMGVLGRIFMREKRIGQRSLMSWTLFRFRSLQMET